MGKLMFGAAMLFAVKAGAQECPQFSIDQLHTMQIAYDVGEPYDLGYTMAAITLHESHAGEVLVGINKGRHNDYGMMMINVASAASRLEINNHYKRNILASRLVTDKKFNAQMALTELLYWQERRSSWKGVVAGYNAGYNKEHGLKHYVPHIEEALSTIKRCVKL